MKQIPKTIHYIWLGGGAHSPLQERCIESWKRNAPDFEIIRWDESNCDVNENPYVSEAYGAKKWAFVSDYFRFKILAQHGGIYMDTDVELHQQIDSLLEHTCFFAFEKQDLVNGAIIGAIPNQPVIQYMIDTYNRDAFIGKDGKHNLTPVPVRITKVLHKQGLKFNGKRQKLSDGIVIYPVNILTLDLGDGKCIAEHHYEFSWSETKASVPYKYYLTKEFFKNGLIVRFVRLLKLLITALGLKPLAKLLHRRLQR